MVIVASFNNIILGFNYTQVNTVILLCMLLLYHGSCRKKFLLSGSSLAVAVSLKIFPLMLGVYHLFSYRIKETLKVMSWSMVTIISFLLILFIFRDITKDLQDFFSALRVKIPHLGGGINQSLLAVSLRLFTPQQDKNIVMGIYYLFAIFCLVRLVYENYRMTLINQKNQTLDSKNTFVLFSLYLLYMIIFSPISWAHYHIMSIPAVYVFAGRTIQMIYEKEKNSMIERRIYIGILAFVVAASFVGRDTLGKDLFFSMRHYGYLVPKNIILFFVLLRELKKQRLPHAH